MLESLRDGLIYCYCWCLDIRLFCDSLVLLLLDLRLIFLCRLLNLHLLFSLFFYNYSNLFLHNTLILSLSPLLCLNSFLSFIFNLWILSSLTRQFFSSYLGNLFLAAIFLCLFSYCILDGLFYLGNLIDLDLRCLCYCLTFLTTILFFNFSNNRLLLLDLFCINFWLIILFTFSHVLSINIIVNLVRIKINTH